MVKKKVSETLGSEGPDMSSTVTVTAPVKSDVMHLNIEHSLQTGKPVIMFSGEWTTRQVKNILRAIPRAYRIHLLNKRKRNEDQFKQEL